MSQNKIYLNVSAVNKKRGLSEDGALFLRLYGTVREPAKNRFLCTACGLITSIGELIKAREKNDVHLDAISSAGEVSSRCTLSKPMEMRKLHNAKNYISQRAVCSSCIYFKLDSFFR